MHPKRGRVKCAAKRSPRGDAYGHHKIKHEPTQRCPEITHKEERRGGTCECRQKRKPGMIQAHTSGCRSEKGKKSRPIVGKKHLFVEPFRQRRQKRSHLRGEKGLSYEVTSRTENTSTWEEYKSLGKDILTSENSGRCPLKGGGMGGGLNDRDRTRREKSFKNRLKR